MARKTKGNAPAAVADAPAAPLGKVFADQIRTWPLDRFKLYERNPRRHSDAVIQRMADSLLEFGFPIPVLARESSGEVIDGHLRIKGARRANLVEAPWINCDNWTPAQVKSFRLMANRSVAWAEWDADLLALEFQDLKDSGYDLNLTGFEELEIQQLFAGTADPKTEWAGMPDFQQNTQNGFHVLTVHFQDQNGMDEFARLLNITITKQTRFIWFPHVERASFEGQRWAGSDEQQQPQA